MTVEVLRRLVHFKHLSFLELWDQLKQKLAVIILCIPINHTFKAIHKNEDSIMHINIAYTNLWNEMGIE